MKFDTITMQDVFNPDWYVKQVDAIHDTVVEQMEPYILDENTRKNVKTMMNASCNLQKDLIRSGDEFWSKIKSMA